MTLKELIQENSLVKDSTTVVLAKIQSSYGAKLRRNGHWYEDQILDLMNQEIYSIKLNSETDSLVVVLK